MSRQCPDDRAALEPQTIHDIQVDVCNKCGGVWLDKGEMMKLRQLEGEQILDFDVTEEDRRRARAAIPNCPVCAEVLFQFRYAGGSAWIEACPNQHGLWIPDVELDKIAAMQEVPEEVAAALVDMAIETQERVSRYNRIADAFRVMGRRFGWPFIRGYRM